MGRQDYQWRHEPCLYGWIEGAAHRWYSDRAQTTVLEFDRPTRSEEHPTMKPVALIACLINNSSRRGDTVLDVFGGSGSTLIACEQTGRRCLMMELDPGYCDVIIRRWEDFTGEKAMR
jgi:site-specific DNA-methyltransferase (adenine-specific)